MGAEEFVQCNSNVLQKTAFHGSASAASSSSVNGGPPSLSSAPIGVQGPKKTCNLETYLEWSSKLKLLVANDILRVGVASSWMLTFSSYFINFKFFFLVNRQPS